MAEAACSNIILTQRDPAIVAMSIAFNAVLSQLISGVSLTPQMGARLMAQVSSGVLPFHQVTQGHLHPPQGAEKIQAGQFSSPDALLTAGYAALAAADPDIIIEPAWKVSLVYGMPCAIYHQLPAAYYLASRFREDYESAVLHAINGGGQNMSRAMLTGALVGAQQVRQSSQTHPFSVVFLISIPCCNRSIADERGMTGYINFMSIEFCSGHDTPPLSNYFPKTDASTRSQSYSPIIRASTPSSFNFSNMAYESTQLGL